MYPNSEFKCSAIFARQKEKDIDQVILTLRERSARAKLSDTSVALLGLTMPLGNLTDVASNSVSAVGNDHSAKPDRNGVNLLQPRQVHWDLFPSWEVSIRLAETKG